MNRQYHRATNLLFLLSTLLQSCSDYSIIRHDTRDNNYLSDARDCFRSSERKVYVKVPTAGTMTVIDVPIGNDASIFSLCMEQAGHKVTKANPDDYLIVSRACSQQANESSTPNDTYAKCIKYGNISIEPIIKK